MTLHDWEVQATYASYKRRYRGIDGALEKMAEYYGERLGTMNPHFVVGNMQKRPGQFILIGALRVGEDSDVESRQQDLL